VLSQVRAMYTGANRGFLIRRRIRRQRRQARAVFPKQGGGCGRAPAARPVLRVGRSGSAHEGLIAVSSRAGTIVGGKAMRFSLDALGPQHAVRLSHGRPSLP
jgi:hypothetical protein